MAAAKKSRKGTKILAVDDDLSDLRTIKMVLEKEGYDVYAASDGRQALELVEEGGFALILLDIRMPELTGYELVRLFREKLDGGTKIVFISIVPQKEVSLKEVDGFVQKPFSPETLVEKVRKAIG